jgi:hypothetical protein
LETICADRRWIQSLYRYRGTGSMSSFQWPQNAGDGA